MFVFVDESGDSGLKIDSGSSRFFTVVLVVFSDAAQMQECDDRIASLRTELGKGAGFEFHFSDNSDRVRKKFLEAVAPFDFFYYAFVLNKDPSKLYGPGFKYKETLYKKVCEYVFENARGRLLEAYVVIDKSGSKTFQGALVKYLMRLNRDSDRTMIKNVKVQRSGSNNLLQLADYMAGVVNRGVQNKKNADDYRRFNAHKEMPIQKWP